MANILIVEDEKNMREIISEYIRRDGHTVFTADDGADDYMTKPFSPKILIAKTNALLLRFSANPYGSVNAVLYLVKTGCQ